MIPRNEDSVYRELSAAEMATFWSQNNKNHHGYFFLESLTWSPINVMSGYFVLHSSSTLRSSQIMNGQWSMQLQDNRIVE